MPDFWMVLPITLLQTVATNETHPTTESSYQPLTQSRPEAFSMMDGWEEAEHEFMGCEGLDELMEMRYEILRKRMGYAVHRGCFFVYSVPGDWCVDYGGGLRCRRQDSVAPVSGWMGSHLFSATPWECGGYGEW